MSGRDEEIDEFLARRKPLFRRTPDDPLEPPEDLDRIVLRRAREAIESDRPQRVYQGPRWIAPLAVAATVVLSIGVILQATTSPRAPTTEVTVQQITQQIDYPPAAAPMAETPPSAGLAAPASGNAVVVDLAPARGTGTTGFAAQDEAARHVMAPPPPPPAAPGESQAPAWRRNSQSWLAEIERLRAAGRNADADAEYAEYKRQHRAYAGSPDR